MINYEKSLTNPAMEQLTFDAFFFSKDYSSLDFMSLCVQRIH